MKKLLKRAFDTYLNPQLNFRVRIFNILAIAGGLLSIYAALASADPVYTLICLLFALLSFSLMLFATWTKKYELCYGVAIVLIFLIFFPILFFASGGYHSAKVFILALAVLSSSFMLKGKKGFIVSTLEILFYCILFVVAYFHPEWVTNYTSEKMHLLDICLGFSINGMAVVLLIYFQLKLYDEQQQQLARHNAKLNRSNREKTEFLSNISHELKTPLTVVSSHIQLAQQELKRYPELSELQNIMQLVSGETERIALMVSQLLDVSCIDEGQMQIVPVRESIVEIIQLTLNTYYPIFSKNHNRLVFLRTSDVPAVLCDRARIMQVLVNLIGNATRHTRDGEITISVGRKSDEATVTVTDSGEGIADEYLPYLFDRYHSHPPAQDDKTRAGILAGTCLGLYICRHIIEQHAGRIWIESELGKGTKVYFTLPLDI